MMHAAKILSKSILDASASAARLRETHKSHLLWVGLPDH